MTWKLSKNLELVTTTTCMKKSKIVGHTPTSAKLFPLVHTVQNRRHGLLSSWNARLYHAEVLAVTQHALSTVFETQSQQCCMTEWLGWPGITGARNMPRHDLGAPVLPVMPVWRVWCHLRQQSCLVEDVFSPTNHINEISIDSSH